MRRSFVLLLAGWALVCPVTVRAEPPWIDVSVAGFYVGQEVIVEGPVRHVERRGNTLRLTLGDPPQALQVSLIESVLERFPRDVEQRYLGKTVRVRGPIHEFRGKIEMIVRDPQQIAIAQETSKREPVADPGEGTPGRIRAIEERLQRLEAGHVRVWATEHATDSVSHAGTSGQNLEDERLRAIEERLRKLEIRIRQIEGKQR